ncbi:hypothetical protein Purlil1_3160 [Purpureocillium lilacinum]|uniref:Uncharacterized protein n=1 Tax=Purpureocillium lilacinum TaxID=33203 RepID=A0ABR0C8E4_PURLI|nr:hypothetical protein Purlil1_3160 [Purpureocillium lilacinum]
MPGIAVPDLPKPAGGSRDDSAEIWTPWHTSALPSSVGIKVPASNYRAPPWDMPCAMNPDGGKGKETLVAADSSTDQRCPDSLPCVSCVEMAMDGEKTSWSGLVLWSPRTTNWCREGGGKLATGWKLAEAARHPALSLAETHTMVGWLRPWTCAYATGQAARLAVRSLKRPDCTARRQAVRVLPNNTAGASGAECRLGRPRRIHGHGSRGVPARTVGLVADSAAGALDDVDGTGPVSVASARHRTAILLRAVRMTLALGCLSRPEELYLFMGFAGRLIVPSSPKPGTCGICSAAQVSVTNMAGPTQATVLDDDRPPSIRDNLGCSPTLFNVGKMASSASLPTSHAPPIHPAPPFLPFLSQEGGEEPRSHPSRATPLPSTASSSGATPRRQDRRSERLTSLVRSTTNRHNQSKRPSGKKKLARDAARLHQQPSTDRPLIRSVANGELSPACLAPIRRSTHLPSSSLDASGRSIAVHPPRVLDRARATSLAHPTFYKQPTSAGLYVGAKRPQHLRPRLCRASGDGRRPFEHDPSVPAHGSPCPALARFALGCGTPFFTVQCRIIDGGAPAWTCSFKLLPASVLDGWTSGHAMVAASSSLHAERRQAR